MLGYTIPFSYINNLTAEFAKSLIIVQVTVFNDVSRVTSPETSFKIEPAIPSNFDIFHRFILVTTSQNFRSLSGDFLTLRYVQRIASLTIRST